MYDVGDIVPLGLSVTDADGNPANGGSVTLTVTLPDLTTANPPVTPGDTGQYTADFQTTLEGAHRVNWTVTGANATAYEDLFNVREIGDQIISLREAKKQLRLPMDSSDHDDDLRLFIAAAGIAVEDHSGRKLVRRTITGEQHRRVCGTLILDRSPVVAVTSVSTVDGPTTWDVDNLNVDTTTGIVTTTAGMGLYGNLTVTYITGMRVIPANYLLAARIITEHLWQTMRPFSTLSVPSVGTLEDSLDARSGGLVGFAIPNRALELIGAPPPLVA